MNRRVAITVTGLAAVASASAVAVPSLASVGAHHIVRHSKASHTLSFTDKPAGKAIDKGPLLIEADDDYHGKTLIGTDNINCNFGKKSAHCLVTLSIKGGMLYGVFTETSSDAISGTITGGAGADKRATGTISAKSHKPIVVKYRD